MRIFTLRNVLKRTAIGCNLHVHVQVKTDDSGDY